jgi:hypothetical protein
VLREGAVPSGLGTECRNARDAEARVGTTGSRRASSFARDVAPTLALLALVLVVGLTLSLALIWVAPALAASASHDR